ncbi:pilus assembly protein [Mariniblastus sp.]|nr:pilus assembly protein [Mariniblastus sp.]
MFSRSISRRCHSQSKRQSSRSGTATVEFALCLPLMALICFGSIQASTSIILRHKTIAILEIGSLDYMLGKVAESDLASHIESLADEFELIGGVATVTPETIEDVEYLRVVLTMPVGVNTTAPMFVVGPDELNSQVLLYRP